MLEITKKQAEGFYAVHAGKPFFNSLTEFMSSGPIVVMALEKENAIADLRKLMGATNPANAEPGTIRKKWAENISLAILVKKQLFSFTIPIELGPPIPGLYV
jgi:nucleoside-diphosphate kinase